MALLLNTHTYLWFIDADPRLSATAAARIGEPDERVLVSVVSAWEIVIKQGTGKLALDRPLEQLWPESITENEFDVMDVTWEHILALSPLPLHHRARSTGCSLPKRSLKPTRSSAPILPSTSIQ